MTFGSAAVPEGSSTRENTIVSISVSVRLKGDPILMIGGSDIVKIMSGNETIGGVM